MGRYEIVPDRSQVWITARSSVHPIHGEGTGLQGYLLLGIVDGQLDLTEPAELHVELPVERLRSGNPLYDREMQRRIEAQKYPRITGTARQIAEVSPGRYRVRGEVTFHGATRTAEGEVTIRVEDQRLVVEGEHVFDVRDFNLEPPRLLMLRVYPEVTVRVRAMAERTELRKEQS